MNPSKHPDSSRSSAILPPSYSATPATNTSRDRPSSSSLQFMVQPLHSIAMRRTPPMSDIFNNTSAYASSLDTSAPNSMKRSLSTDDGYERADAEMASKRQRASGFLLPQVVTPNTGSSYSQRAPGIFNQVVQPCTLPNHDPVNGQAIPVQPSAKPLNFPKVQAPSTRKNFAIVEAASHAMEELKGALQRDFQFATLPLGVHHYIVQNMTTHLFHEQHKFWLSHFVKQLGLPAPNVPNTTFSGIEHDLHEQAFFLAKAYERHLETASQNGMSPGELQVLVHQASFTIYRTHYLLLLQWTEAWKQKPLSGSYLVGDNISDVAAPIPPAAVVTPTVQAPKAGSTSALTGTVQQGHSGFTLASPLPGLQTPMSISNPSVVGLIHSASPAAPSTLGDTSGNQTSSAETLKAKSTDGQRTADGRFDIFKGKDSSAKGDLVGPDMSLQTILKDYPNHLALHRVAIRFVDEGFKIKDMAQALMNHKVIDSVKARYEGKFEALKLWAKDQRGKAAQHRLNTDRAKLKKEGTEIIKKSRKRTARASPVTADEPLEQQSATSGQDTVITTPAPVSSASPAAHVGDGTEHLSESAQSHQGDNMLMANSVNANATEVSSEFLADNVDAISTEAWVAPNTNASHYDVNSIPRGSSMPQPPTYTGQTPAPVVPAPINHNLQTHSEQPASTTLDPSTTFNIDAIIDPALVALSSLEELFGGDTSTEDETPTNSLTTAGAALDSAPAPMAPAETNALDLDQSFNNNASSNTASSPHPPAAAVATAALHSAPPPTVQTDLLPPPRINTPPHVTTAQQPNPLAAADILERIRQDIFSDIEDDSAFWL